MSTLKSVLLVDDDETTNFLNKFFVKQVAPNVEVNSVANGKEAIDFINVHDWNESKPCLLILDTNMPVMNGWEFLDAFETIFDKSIKRHFKIVMLVTVDSPEFVDEALGKPYVSDTATKPLSDIKFRALINKHF